MPVISMLSTFEEIRGVMVDSELDLAIMGHNTSLLISLLSPKSYRNNHRGSTE